LEPTPGVRGGQVGRSGAGGVNWARVPLGPAVLADVQGGAGGAWARGPCSEGGVTGGIGLFKPRGLVWASSRRWWGGRVGGVRMTYFDGGWDGSRLAQLGWGGNGKY